jgi:type I restriction-modification system DNA methylase subunit
MSVNVNLTKSKKRIADHGEVFTPAWMVEAMLDLVKGETERIDSRFLEPACGSGNFLMQILRRKLAAVELKYGKSDFERRHYALLALMSIYGIELLSDNIAHGDDHAWGTGPNKLSHHTVDSRADTVINSW